MWRNRNKYVEKVAAGLDEAYENAAVETITADHERIVIFSDLHRGTGDRADDFRPCRKIYHAALGYYNALDYRLVLLGDIEELWERMLAGILEHYASTLELEQRFFNRGKGTRLLGNHDETLTWPWHKSKIGQYTNEAPLLDGLRLRLAHPDGHVFGEMLLVHGHQGIGYSWFDRFAVKRLWAPVQRLTGITLGTPATQHGIRDLHEWSLYRWASQRSKLLLVCGHTHHPVFMSAAWEESVRSDLEKLRQSGADEETLAMKEAELHWIAADLDEMRVSLPDDPKPCYFNTGCCSYSDGSITGIEIENGRIRLVRWTGESGSPVRERLRGADLPSIFSSWNPEVAEVKD